MKKIIKKYKKSLKNFQPSKTFIAISFMLIGIGGTVLAQNIVKEKRYYISSPKQDRYYDDPFEDVFFRDPFFEEIRHMRREFNREFRRHIHNWDHAFRRNYYRPNNVDTKIVQQETKDEYIYELNYKGFKKEDIFVEIKDKNLIISAQKDEKTAKFDSFSNFYYSFYVPDFDKKTKPDISRENSRITITLKKIN